MPQGSKINSGKGSGFRQKKGDLIRSIAGMISAKWLDLLEILFLTYYGKDLSQLQCNMGLSLWWFILCVNFTGLWDAQIAGKTSFLGVSVREFLGKISIWICRLSEKDSLHQCRWASSTLLRDWIEQNIRGIHPLAWAGTSVFSWSGASVILVLGPLDLD